MKDKDLRKKFDDFIEYQFRSVIHGKVVEKIESFIESLKECETCGCLLLNHAIKGKSIIKQKKTFSFGFESGEVDYLHTPYYCKVHAPKVE